MRLNLRREKTHLIESHDLFFEAIFFFCYMKVYLATMLLFCTGCLILSFSEKSQKNTKTFYLKSLFFKPYETA